MNEYLKEIGSSIHPREAPLKSVVQHVNDLNEQADRCRRSDTTASLELSRLAFELASASEYLQGAAYSRVNIGYCLLLTGDHKAALTEEKEAISLFEKLGDDKGKALALRYFGRIFMEEGEFTKAIEIFSKSLRISEDLNDCHGICGTINNLGNVYYFLGDYTKALDYFQQTLQISEKNGYKEDIGHPLCNIGVIYHQIGQYEMAIGYFNKALQSFRQVGDITGEAICLSDMGDSYREIGDIDNSLKCLLEALEISKKTLNKYNESIAYDNLGHAYRDAGDYENAFESYTLGLRASREAGHKAVEIEILLGLGEISGEQGEYDRAVELLTQSIQLAEAGEFRELIYKSHLALSGIYESQGDFERALTHHKEFYNVRQKVLSEEADKNLKRVLAQAEAEKAQKEAEILRLRHVELASRVKELEASLLKSKLDALKAQLHPHFLFNSLHSITALVLKKENQAAVQMINQLSDLLRSTLNQDDSFTIELSREIDFIKRYLEIEQIRFQDRLKVGFNIDPETLPFQVPPMILQPVVENAIRHAIAAHSFAERIEISSSIKNGKLLIEVRDDGPGLSDSHQASNEGLGLENTRKRLLEIYEEDFTFDLRNEPEKGAVATFCLPLKTKEAIPLISTADE